MVRLSPLLAVAAASVFLEGTLAQKCTGQSCEIANLSGSTGIPFKLDGGGKKPTGSNDQGFKCIQKHNQYGAGVPPGSTKQPADGAEGSAESAPSSGSSGAKGAKGSKGGKGVGSIRDFQRDILNSNLHWPERRQGACKPYTLIFARGTTEPGTMGSTVGPSLSSGLRSAQAGKWDVEGVSYSADIAGDNCIGLPGGVKCMAQINKIAEKCPQTKMVVSGYSQGAMVARNCVAFATPQARKQVAGVVVFGDPFNGAPIKDFPSENIKTYCMAGDGVCQGKFVITASHLAYVGTSTSDAVRWITKRVQGS